MEAATFVVEIGSHFEFVVSNAGKHSVGANSVIIPEAVKHVGFV